MVEQASTAARLSAVAFFRSIRRAICSADLFQAVTNLRKPLLIFRRNQGAAVVESFEDAGTSDEMFTGLPGRFLGIVR